ncbi:MAG: hypothetical protein M3Y58_04845 [Chloroflexota bacterium]|nr:hypothetical protein [Chloroflexota bacterium]
MIEQGQKQRRATRRTVNIPHFWGWVAFAIVVAAVITLAVFHPLPVPKSVVFSTAAIIGLWWLLGGLFFRARFAKAIRKRRRSGLRVGGWALDGWQARHQRHGSYWRAVRSWTRTTR